MLRHLSWIEWFIIAAILLIIGAAILFAGTDGRECKRYGAPIYVKVGDVIVPVVNCAEYYEEAPE